MSKGSSCTKAFVDRESAKGLEPRNRERSAGRWRFGRIRAV